MVSKKTPHSTRRSAPGTNAPAYELAVASGGRLGVLPAGATDAIALEDILTNDEDSLTLFVKMRLPKRVAAENIGLLDALHAFLKDYGAGAILADATTTLPASKPPPPAPAPKSKPPAPKPPAPKPPAPKPPPAKKPARKK